MTNAEKFAKRTDLMCRTIRSVCDLRDYCEGRPFEWICDFEFYIGGETDDKLKEWLESEVEENENIRL